MSEIKPTSGNAIFTYLCTDCRKRNKTYHPPEDNMLHCEHCGYMTVQTFEQIEGKTK